MKKIILPGLIISALIFNFIACEKERPKAETVEPEPLPEGAQAVSFLGKPLFSPGPSENALAAHAAAKTEYENNPDDADLLIAYGRRTVGLGQFREAIEIFTQGIEKHPDNPVLYRRRGHRNISTRQIEAAIQDLKKAAQLVRDNPADESLHFDIWYHLGLAYYLKNDMENAANAYRECLNHCEDSEAMVAVSNWLFMALRRLRQNEASDRILEPIHAGLEVKENALYHQLLLFYKGEVSQEKIMNMDLGGLQNSGLMYGIGNWHYYNGNLDEARTIFEQIIQSEGWAAFGYIAAEADLSRIK